MELTDFLLARIAEDEEAARAALGSTWGVGRLSGVRGSHVYTRDKTVPYTGGQVADVAHQHEPTADHIALWDPARVLAECAAKRRIVQYEMVPPDVRTDSQKHAACAHPDWEYETTVGPRKSWGDEDVPPDGDGWVRNLDRGNDGWERFDYTEEAYWRRPKSAQQQSTEPVVLRLLALPYADHADYDPQWRP